MSLQTFSTQYECTTDVFCVKCRDLESGRPLRRNFAEFFRIPAVDFACPRGKPWGYAGGDISTIKPCRKRRQPAFVKSSETPDRAQACFECGWFDDVCRVRFPDGIGPTCWDKFLTNAASKCPAGKWGSTLSKDSNRRLADGI